MPLKAVERNWLERAEQAANDPEIHGEGVSIRIVIYLLREIVQLRENEAALEARIDALEGL